MAQALLLKTLSLFSTLFIGGGTLMQMPIVQKAIQADEVDSDLYRYATLFGLVLLIIERLMAVWEKKKKSDMELYEKKKEIDNRYPKNK